MDPVTFWQEQGVSFGSSRRVDSPGDDEFGFKEGVCGTEERFRALCSQKSVVSFVPKTQTEFERFFRVFHQSAYSVYFPVREEDTGVEALLLWFPERSFLDLNINNTSVFLTFEVAGNYWLSVGMIRRGSKFLFSWDLSRLEDRIVNGEVHGQHRFMERWGRKSYSFESYVQALSCLFELVKTGQFSLFPQRFFLAPDFVYSLNTIRAQPLSLKKPELPKKFRKLVLDDYMEIDSGGRIHFSVKTGSTYLYATVVCGWDQGVVPEQPFVSYYWKWTDSGWKEDCGWSESEEEAIEAVDCTQDRLQETFYQCLLLMFDGVGVKKSGFYDALFTYGTHFAGIDGSLVV